MTGTRPSIRTHSIAASSASSVPARISSTMERGVGGTWRTAHRPRAGEASAKRILRTIRWCARSGRPAYGRPRGASNASVRDRATVARPPAVVATNRPVVAYHRRPWHARHQPLTPDRIPDLADAVRPGRRPEVVLVRLVPGPRARLVQRDGGREPRASSRRRRQRAGPRAGTRRVRRRRGGRLGEPRSARGLRAARLLQGRSPRSTTSRSGRSCASSSAGSRAARASPARCSTPPSTTPATTARRPSRPTRSTSPTARGSRRPTPSTARSHVRAGRVQGRGAPPGQPECQPPRPIVRQTLRGRRHARSRRPRRRPGLRHLSPVRHRHPTRLTPARREA